MRDPADMSRDEFLYWEAEYERRQRGINRPLTQAEHAAVNNRYPGCTVKHCPVCDQPIDDAQTVCSEECWNAMSPDERGPQ